MPMKLETENVEETEASAELVRELMADDARRGNWLILMHDDDDAAFMQIAFDDHPDGIDLEYREGADKPLYHCKRPVLRLEAENALLDYLDGIDTWKHRFEWEVEEEFGGACGSIRKFVPGPVLFVAIVAAVVAAVVNIGKLPRNMRLLPVFVIILVFLAFHILRWVKAKPEKFKTLDDLDDDDGGIDWRETGAKDVVVDTCDGWAVLMDYVPVYEAKAAAQALEDAHIRCRLDILSEDRAYHRYGNGGLGTRMCVLVAPEDYEKAKKLVDPDWPRSTR